MTIDIIVSTHNRSKLLQKTLKSVAAQTYHHWTCWIAEDGETKETFEAIRPFLKDDRFIYLPEKHAGFPAIPRNRAIRKGNAKYVAMLDDDDLWLPEKLERQIEFLTSHPNCVLLGCNAFCWTGTGKWDESHLYFKKNMLGKIRYKELLCKNYIVHSSAMLQRTAIEQAGLYNESLKPPIGEDYELWLRVGVLGEISVLSEPYTVYTETPKMKETSIVQAPVFWGGSGMNWHQKSKQYSIHSKTNIYAEIYISDYQLRAQKIRSHTPGIRENVGAECLCKTLRITYKTHPSIQQTSRKMYSFF
jgi:glycosyltransferase involved in cell wall biosynthesis